MKPKTDPATVRALLDETETSSSVLAVARRHGIHHSKLYKWRRHRAASGGIWPTDQDIANWRATETKRQRQAAIHQRYKKRRYAAGDKSMRIPAIGTRRRLQALARLGHTLSDIGGDLNLSAARLSQLMRGNRSGKYVLIETAARVAEVYERRCMVIPQGWVHDRTRRMAERNGWAPPLAWSDIDDPNEKPAGARDTHTKHDVDPVVVDRVLAGDRLPMTAAERRLVVARARALGWSEETIKARTGIAKATDKRYRQAAS